MTKPRAYSQYGIEAASLLGKHIKLNRKQRHWTELNLADRAGISRATLQKIEKGSLTCAIGLVFEVASLVGVKLFEDESTTLTRHHEMINDKISLLPKSVRNSKIQVDDEF